MNGRPENKSILGNGHSFLELVKSSRSTKLYISRWARHGFSATRSLKGRDTDNAPANVIMQIKSGHFLRITRQEIGSLCARAFAKRFLQSPQRIRTERVRKMNLFAIWCKNFINWATSFCIWPILYRVIQNRPDNKSIKMTIISNFKFQIIF